MQDLLQSRFWLAPLTRGGHMAFRRLCGSEGAEGAVGEMALVLGGLDLDGHGEPENAPPTA